jgi:hypothetical protein
MNWKMQTSTYGYAVDDVPHRDLLDCVAEDGSLLSLLEPGTGMGAAGAP